MSSIVPLNGGLPFDPQATLERIVDAARECINVHEVESTKRDLIRMERDVLLEELRVKEAVFLEYLDRAFDERKSNFRALFSQLSTAIDSGDTAAMGGILGSITTLAVSGPFKDLQDIDFVAAKLRDLDHEWPA